MYWYKRKTMVCIVSAVVGLVCIGLPANGKAAERGKKRRVVLINLRNQVGLGAVVGLDTSLNPSPRLSVKYWVNPTFGMQFFTGVSLRKFSEAVSFNNSTYTVEQRDVELYIGGRLNFNVVRRNRINFYVFLGSGGIFRWSSDKYREGRGFFVHSGAGTEFFIPLVQSLALDLEMGVEYQQIGDNYSLALNPGIFGLAGFHFYF